MNKNYSLKKGCCGIELSLPLCAKHLAIRIAGGWSLQRENGPVNDSCYDCKSEGQV